MNWVNKILELQYKDYEDFISNYSTRPTNFKSISKKVKIEISQGRRTAFLLPKENQKEHSRKNSFIYHHNQHISSSKKSNDTNDIKSSQKGRIEIKMLSQDL